MQPHQLEISGENPLIIVTDTSTQSIKLLIEAVIAVFVARLNNKERIMILFLSAKI